MLQYNPSITGSLTVTGSINASQGITGSLSGTVDGINVTSFSSSIVSTINIVNGSTGSYATTGSNTFTGTQVVQGTLTAQTLVVQTVTSSVLFSTGSNKIGSSLSNVQELTGSVGITGSLSVNTNGTEFQVSAGGVNIGNALTDNHVISGSVRINPNGLFVSSSGNVGIGTTTPSQLFEVVGGEIKAGRVDTSNEGGQISFGRSTDNNTAWYIDAYGNVASPQLRFVNVADSLVAMTISGSRVGIGTSTPNAPLQISSATGTNVNPAVNITNTTLNGYGVLRLTGNSRGGFIDFYDNTTAQASIVGQGGAFYVYTNGDSSGTPKVSITSGGNIELNSAGMLYSTSAVISIPNSATTIFSSSGFGGVWLVTYVVSGNPAQVGYAIVGNAFGSTLTLLASAAGSQTALSISGLNLQLSQSAGGSINTRINVLRLNSTFA
jgi:hypothetical protein